MAERYDLDAIAADDALLDLLAAGGEAVYDAREAAGGDPAVQLLADLRVAVEVEDELPIERIEDAETFLARCAALNPVTDPLARKVATRTLALGVAAVAALSVSGVAAAVTGDPLSPYEKVIEKMVDGLMPETSFPQEELEGLPVNEKAIVTKVAKDWGRKRAEQIRRDHQDLSDPFSLSEPKSLVEQKVKPPLAQRSLSSQLEEQDQPPLVTETTEPKKQDQVEDTNLAVKPTVKPTVQPTTEPTEELADPVDPADPVEPETDPTPTPTETPTPTPTETTTTPPPPTGSNDTTGEQTTGEQTADPGTAIVVTTEVPQPSTAPSQSDTEDRGSEEGAGPGQDNGTDPGADNGSAGSDNKADQGSDGGDEGDGTGQGEDAGDSGLLESLVGHLPGMTQESSAEARSQVKAEKAKVKAVKAKQARSIEAKVAESRSEQGPSRNDRQPAGRLPNGQFTPEVLRQILAVLNGVMVSR